MTSGAQTWEATEARRGPEAFSRTTAKENGLRTGGRLVPLARLSHRCSVRATMSQDSSLTRSGRSVRQALTAYTKLVFRQNLPKYLHECRRRGDVRAMAGAKFEGSPASLAIGTARELSERLFVGIPRAVNICARQIKFSLQLERLLETLNRLGHPKIGDPPQILWRRIGRNRIRGDAPTVARLSAVQQSLPLVRR